MIEHLGRGRQLGSPLGGLFWALTVATGLAAQPNHPLEPLDRGEVDRAARAVKADRRFAPTMRFATIGLKEPPKAAVLGWPSTVIRREALVLVHDWATTRLSEVTIDLTGGQVSDWRILAGKQAWVMERDASGVDSLLRADPRWRAALARRGVTDLDQVGSFGGPADGYFPLPGDGARYLAVFTNWRPPRRGIVEGLVSFVDMTRGRVVAIRDVGGNGLSHPEVEVDSVRKIPPRGEPPKPLEIRQPEGPGYRVDGHHVEWLDWKFRFGVESRGGLVLYQTSFREGGRDRPVLYRAAPSEMAVPYGDPGWRIWMPLDIGFVGLGNYSKTSLGPGRDVPENATFFESVMYDEAGASVVVPRAAALYERDGGLLWRHGDESRRARELVLAFCAKVDNYDYGFRWVFRQDGTLALEVELTGQMGSRAVPATTEREFAATPSHRYGTLVAPHVVAPNHQHFFSFQLDLDVDGPKNRVYEMNVAGEPAAPYRANGLATHHTLLARELAARRQMNLGSSRMWKVVSSTETNRLGQATGYGLMPAENATPMVPPNAFIRRHVGFVNYHLWVTPQRDDERYAAGTYAFINGSGDGLPKWTRANRALVDEDVVLWYTLGVTHVPRPEDWPLMPVHKTGFKLVPLGFFSENPTIALPERR